MENRTIDGVPAFVYFADTKEKILDRIEYLRSRGLVGILNITEVEFNELPNEAQEVIIFARSNNEIEFLDQESEDIFWDEPSEDDNTTRKYLEVCEMQDGEISCIHLMMYFEEDRK